MEIRHTWVGIEQPQDEQTAGSPWFYISSYREFQKGLILALQEVEKYSALTKELELEFSPFEKEKQRLNRMIEWEEDRLKKSGQTSDDDEIVLSGVTYGSLRYLKAGILLRAHHLIEKRQNVLRDNRFVPRSVVQSFDERIEQLLNLAEQGMLNGLQPADIFFEIVPKEGNIAEKGEPRLKSIITGTGYSNLEIPIVDPVLRKRCLSLLRAITEGGSEEQLDSVIREMSVVLEDRVREVSGHTGKLSGAELLSAVMTKEPPQIKFSNQKDIQESAHLLFRGYSGFVRNEAMHKLVPSYTQERVLQLLGTVDYLLFLLSRAERPKSKQEGV